MAAEFGLKDNFPSLGDDQLRMIKTYVEIFLKFNKVINLSSTRDPDEWLSIQLFDCITAYNAMRNRLGNHFADIGSGNGLPGIIFGILSGVSFTLVERDQRKAEFLKHIIRSLDLNGNVFSSNLKELSSSIDVSCFVYRGFGPPSLIVDNIKKFPNSTHVRMSSKDQVDKEELGRTNLLSYSIPSGREYFLEVISTSDE